MPALYAFVVCEKIILDQGGVASLISLFTIINAGVPVGLAELPPNAIAPKEWAIFASWDWERGDDGKEYTQHVQILNPDGTPFAQIPDVKITMQPGRKTQITHPVLGIPIGQVGQCTVRLWLEHNEVIVFEARPIHIDIRHAAPG